MSSIKEVQKTVEQLSQVVMQQQGVLESLMKKMVAEPAPAKSKPSEWVQSKLDSRTWKAPAGPGFDHLRYARVARVCVTKESERSKACAQAKGAFRLVTIASLKSLDSTEKGKRWYWNTCPDCKAQSAEKPGEF